MGDHPSPRAVTDLRADPRLHTLATLPDLRSAALPVGDPLADLLPDGLVRGRTVACGGDAAVSLALHLVAAATQAGSWLALFDDGRVGLLAAHERGVALQRTVLVSPPRDPSSWSSALATAVDGFEVVAAFPPRGASPADLRRVQARVQARGAVLVLVDPRRRVPAPQADTVLATRTRAWHGIADGAGHLESRDVDVEVAGRRTARPRRAVLRIAG
ncbi:MAG: hypothetical protein EBU70_05010 [Actinobacteria bacterium]|nr:hypothetical protein [Actinomycetota bacterium]